MLSILSIYLSIHLSSAYIWGSETYGLTSLLFIKYRQLWSKFVARRINNLWTLRDRPSFRAPVRVVRVVTEVMRRWVSRLERWKRWSLFARTLCNRWIAWNDLSVGPQIRSCVEAFWLGVHSRGPGFVPLAKPIKNFHVSRYDCAISGFKEGRGTLLYQKHFSFHRSFSLHVIGKVLLTKRGQVILFYPWRFSSV